MKSLKNSNFETNPKRKIIDCIFVGNFHFINYFGTFTKRFECKIACVSVMSAKANSKIFYYIQFYFNTGLRLQKMPNHLDVYLTNPRPNYYYCYYQKLGCNQFHRRQLKLETKHV